MLRYSAILLFLSSSLLFSPLQSRASESIATDTIVQQPANTTRVLLIPHTEAILSGELSACIERITVNIGDQFKKDDLLVQFNCSIYQAGLNKAKALQKEAEKIVEVNKRLEKLSSVSELEVSAAIARLDLALAETAIQKHLVSRCSIYAPFSGGVVKRIAAPYQYVTPGQPVLEIIDTHNIDVQIHTPSQWVKKIQISSPFSIHIDEVDKSYNGVITALSSRIDPVSQTIELRGKIKGENAELLAGMSGTAYFNIE